MRLFLIGVPIQLYQAQVDDMRVIGSVEIKN
jgi:hypothetical protein